VRLAKEYWRLICENPIYSKVYLNAVTGILPLGPKTYVPWVRHWIVVNLVPESLYKAYRGTKSSLSQDKSV